MPISAVRDKEEASQENDQKPETRLAMSTPQYLKHHRLKGNRVLFGVYFRAASSDLSSKKKGMLAKADIPLCVLINEAS